MSTDDIEAINTYFLNTPIKTPEAGSLQAQFKTWYAGLNFITKAFDDTFKEASIRRSVFNAANNDPEDLTHAADLKPGEAVAKQAAIAQSPALSVSQKKVAIAHNPTVPTTSGVPSTAVKHATIRQGSKGADVTAWQQIIGVTADGNFGTGTAAATKSWQTAHGLAADGVVGPKSWSAAVGAPVQEAPNLAAAMLPPISPTFPTPKAAQAPLISPTPTVHEKASSLNPIPSPVIKFSSGTIATSIKKGFDPVKASAVVGIPTIAGAFFGGPIGAFIGSGVGALLDIFVIK